MREIDRDEAASMLRGVRHGLRRGAEAVGPRRPRRYVAVTCLLAALLGASFDIPAGLWGVGAIIRFPLPMLIVLVWTLYTRAEWRARPSPRAFGRYGVVLAVAAHLVGFSAATLLGLALRDAGTPLPFTLAGLAYGVLFVVVILLGARRLATRYAEGIGQGRW
ncbi:hypothetical protein ACI2K4_09190 [Micromonospora sp. NPDC050397]|uniref:hypothetical protein n=1 Tax=Micromonospora sp. NPDC050397 TaxID=3364279 RepID=UPI00384EB9B0